MHRVGCSSAMRWDELLAHAISTVLAAPPRPSPPESSTSGESLGSNAPAYTSEGTDWLRPLPATPPLPPAPTPAELEADDAGQMFSHGSAQVAVVLGSEEQTSPVQRLADDDVAALLRLLLPDTVEIPGDAAPSPSSQRAVMLSTLGRWMHQGFERGPELPAPPAAFISDQVSAAGVVPAVARQARAPRETIGSWSRVPENIENWSRVHELPLHPNHAPNTQTSRGLDQAPDAQPVPNEPWYHMSRGDQTRGSRVQEDIGSVDDLPRHPNDASPRETEDVGTPTAAGIDNALGAIGVGAIGVLRGADAVNPKP